MTANMSDVESDLSEDDIFEDAVDFVENDNDQDLKPLDVKDLTIDNGGEEEDFDPEMLLRVRDLDTGREYELEKVYKIKDLDSGKEFIVDPSTSPEQDPNGNEKASVGVVKDMETGKEFSILEFENEMGVRMTSPIMREVDRRARERGEQSEDDNDQDDDALSDNDGNQKKAKSTAKKIKSKGKWVAKRMKNVVQFMARDKNKATQKVDEQNGTDTTTVEKVDSEISNPPEDGTNRTNNNGTVEEVVEGVVLNPNHKQDGNNHGVVNGIRDQGNQNSKKAIAIRDVETKVLVHRKAYKDFTDMRFAQSISAHDGAIWTMKFSVCENFVATAGQDHLVKVWKVSPTENEIEKPESPKSRGETKIHDKSSITISPDHPKRNTSKPLPSSADHIRPRTRSLLKSTPYRIWRGHKEDVLDVAWSRTQFLLSSSMDQTVRLWHVSMAECLRIFTHPDFVTAIDFHPVNDKFFLSGSLDQKLRIWNIPEHRVTDWTDVHEMITAAAFSRDGKRAVVGSYRGKCRFYSVDNNSLAYQSQIEVKSRRGKNSRGKKVTGLQFHPLYNTQLMVTTNDSRIRVYNGYNMHCKYKGLQNGKFQIKASFSDDGNFIICGSEDKCVYMWSTINSYVPLLNLIGKSYQRDHNASYEHFNVQEDIVTVAIFAPKKYRCVKHSNDTENEPNGQNSPSRKAHNNHFTSPTVLLENQAEMKQGYPSASGPVSHRQPESRTDAIKAGESAFMAAHALGKVVVTASLIGNINIFENYGIPQGL